MVKLDNVSKAFGEKRVLEGFSYRFAKGGSYAIVGRSGAGKSTLLKLICGVLKPDGGSVTVANGARVRMVFQEDRLLPWKTVLENVVLEEGDADFARRLLSELGMAEEADAFPKTLSGGMGRRVAIARALCAKPDVLLLDEPFNGLDADMKKRAADLISSEMKGKTVLTVTHDEDALAGYVDGRVELA